MNTEAHSHGSALFLVLDHKKEREAVSSIRLPALREASAMNKFVRIVDASSSRLDQHGGKTR
jgi:hypothetical protein